LYYSRCRKQKGKIVKTIIIAILMIFLLFLTPNVQGQIIFPIGNDSTDFGKDITPDKA